MDKKVIGEVLAADFANPLNSTRAHRVTLSIIRLGQRVDDRPPRDLLVLLWRLADAVWLRVVMSAEFPPSARIGPGLGLPHGGRGVSIAVGAEIGANCTIFPFVTIGRDGRSAAPCLQDNVYVATGARILGAVTVGSSARVGANSVVIRDVPAGATAFGVPARILRDDASGAERSR